MKINTILMVMLVLSLPIVPVAAADSDESFTSAGALYSKSVDLANDGKYQEALDAADNALAMNVTSLSGLIQSNRAGILVMLHRNTEAIAAADAALAVEGNLTTVHSIALYNKGNALRALGRIAEAQDTYTKAYSLDSSLVPPDMSGDMPLSLSTTIPLTMNPPKTITTVSPSSPSPTTPRSSLPVTAGIAAVIIALLICLSSRKPSG